MNKDQALKKDDTKLILLVTGNRETGKKSIVNKWHRNISQVTEDNKSFYKAYHFTYEYSFDNIQFQLPTEIRILNSDEIETDLKINSTFFKGALGAFVCTSIEDLFSFQDGAKWKEKIDLMCCLPNKFPLPIFLLINKCDRIDQVKRSQIVEKTEIDTYVCENQFFNHFYISAENPDLRDTTNCSQYVPTVEIDTPLKEMLQVILNFKDIKEKLLGLNNLQNSQNLGTQLRKAGTKESKQSSTTSSRKNDDSTVMILDKDKKENKCDIL